MFQPFISAALYSAEMLVERFSLSNKNISPKGFETLHFLSMFVLLLIGVPFFFVIKEFHYAHLFLFAGVIATTILFNLLLFEGMKRTTVEHAQPFMLSITIFVIFFSVMLFPDERNFWKVLLGLIAGITLVLSRMKKGHVRFETGEKFLLGFAIMLAMHNMFVNQLLDYYNSFTLYFIRAGFVALFLLIFFRFKKTDIQGSNVSWTILFSFIVAIENLFLFWSFSVNGLVITSLVMTLAPLGTIWLGWLVLKEKLEIRDIIATVVIMACVIGSFFV